MSRFQRKDQRREEAVITVIACEGQTEVAYFDAMRTEFRKSAEVIRIVQGGSAPISVVEEARETREALKKKRIWKPGDTAWAVFDGEEHQQTKGKKESWNTAIQRAKSLEIKLANSNPSFELWLLLHHQDQTASIYRDDVLAKLKERNPDYAKGKEGSRKYGAAAAKPDKKLPYDMKLLWSFISKASIEYAPLVNLSGFQSGKGRQPFRLKSRKVHERSI